jgi:hypothetical protein
LTISRLLEPRRFELAQFQVMYWKDIPAQVKASDGTGNAKVMLPSRFSEAIDAAAMADGSTDGDAYMAGWQWSPAEERDGSPQAVADQIAAELDSRFPKDKLIEMIKAHKGLRP